jgi:hypothetical protein
MHTHNPVIPTRITCNFAFFMADGTLGGIRLHILPALQRHVFLVNSAPPPSFLRGGAQHWKSLNGGFLYSSSSGVSSRVSWKLLKHNTKFSVKANRICFIQLYPPKIATQQLWVEVVIGQVHDCFVQVRCTSWQACVADRISFKKHDSNVKHLRSKQRGHPFKNLTSILARIRQG